MKSSDINNAHINDHRPSGIIDLNKPQEYTSHDCISVMRRLTGIKKIGHTGTLDPMAEGVLPICIGSATRIMEYLDGDIKKYRCTLRLGIETDTLDIWGEEKAQHDPETDREKIEKVFESFSGEVEQLPPIYSAIKVHGKRLYQYAREGQDVVIKPRKIIINDMHIESISGADVTFTVECSKGTYIRSICRDVGDMLGCGAAMAALTRLRSGVFTLEDSVTLAELEAMRPDEIFAMMKTPDYPLTHFGKASLGRDTAKDLIDGKYIDMKDVEITKPSSYGEMYRMYLGDTFLGTAHYSERYDTYKAHKIFTICI